MSLFQECEKIVTLEKRRRGYIKELKKIMDAREKKETVKRLTMQHHFKRKALPIKIPSPHNSQDEEELD